MKKKKKNMYSLWYVFEVLVEFLNVKIIKCLFDLLFVSVRYDENKFNESMFYRLVYRCCFIVIEIKFVNL